jgi:hypothetical protein
MIKKAIKIKRLKKSNIKEIEFIKAIKPSSNALSIARNTLNRS